MSEPIKHLNKLRQSLWYDNIQRRLLENGELQGMIERGEIRGVTSNPSIFHNAIAKSNDYDSALTPLAWSGWNAEDIFWQLAIEDIRAAADLFKPLYEKSKGGDGYVSLEVSPLLANNTDATIAQAKHLWETVNRPNLMIKIPATKAGIPAIRATSAAGINVNVTLIFSLERYAEVMDAYLTGLEDRIAAGHEVRHIASVASFFISRVDSKIDPKLAAESPLLGKAAIANAKLAYHAFEEIFTSPRFHALHARYYARVQRPLWASTSTKNPKYPDTIYVDNLIGPDTVNTVPPQTLEAFKDHGKAKVTITRGVDEARAEIEALEKLGIAMAQVTYELELEGVKAFEDAFNALLATIDERRKAALDQIKPLADSVKQRVAQLTADSASAKMHANDPTLWTNDPAGQAEIRIRLGWLKLPETARAALDEIKTFAAHIQEHGFKKVLLLGMGGSSLAPEVISLVFSPPLKGGAGGGVDFAILDSTDPVQALETFMRFPPAKTLYIVSSKSGGTAEVNAMFNYFWAAAVTALGDKAGKHFIAITDPGTGLEALAKDRGFAKIFNADSTVGGRYSALTHFGLVPAALMGLDVEKFLARAAWMMKHCAADVPAARNPGLVLGAILGQAALDGRDKLTLITDPQLSPVGSWLEQLIAESSGKQGRGIVVVDGETVGNPGEVRQGKDRLFVYLRLNGAHDEHVQALQKSGQPVLVFPFADEYDLAAEFYRWEVATAIACAVLGVNAFDQPDVQDAKDRTRAKIAAYAKDKKFDEGKPVFERDGISVYATVAIRGSKLKDVLNAFLAGVRTNDYVAINAYVPRNARMNDLLHAIRLALGRRTGVATTLGYGPRFLHSTGQLHKGGADNGVFFEITANALADVEIPEQGLTFGALERGQALGDYEALAARQRRIIRVNLPSLEAMSKLLEALG